MSNKNHVEYINYFKDKISSLTTVDIPNQPNAINGEDLMKKFKNLKNIKSAKLSDLMTVKGINEKIALNIIYFFE